MQVSHLSALILACFLIGCANPNISREIQEAPEQAAVVMDDATEIAAAKETAEEVRIAAMQVEEKEDQQSVLYSLWWTWKYTMWGQGSSEAWPWAW